ncbi:MAG: glycosyltransferase family 2 protein [Pseudomonadota bacterium]
MPQDIGPSTRLFATTKTAPRFDFSRMAAVTQIRDSADIIGLTLNHLRDVGFKKFVVADHGSTDDTLDIVRHCARRFSDCEIAVLEDPVGAFKQAEKVTALATLARNYFNTDWILPYDADDFFWAAPGPDVDLDACGDFIELPWLQAHPGLTPFTQLPRLLQAPQLTTMFATKLPKVLFKWQPDRVLGTGFHRVFRRTLPPLKGVDGGALGLASLHFPLRTNEQFRSKIVGGQHAVHVEGVSEQICSHWRKAFALIDGSNHAALDKLFEHFWNRDGEAFDDLCRKHGIEPKTLAYVHDMVVGDPLTFPAQPLPQEAARKRKARSVWSVRPRSDMSALEHKMVQGWKRWQRVLQPGVEAVRT